MGRPHLDAVLLRARRGSGKRFRSRLVELSARLVLAARGEIRSLAKSASPSENLADHEVAIRVSEAGRAIEDIHLGSLVVDDIQDGSLVRRGGTGVASSSWRAASFECGQLVVLFGAKEPHANSMERCLRM